MFKTLALPKMGFEVDWLGLIRSQGLDKHFELLQRSGVCHESMSLLHKIGTTEKYGRSDLRSQVRSDIYMLAFCFSLAIRYIT